VPVLSAAAVAASFQAPLPIFASTRNCVSSLELSLQVSSTWVEERAVAVRSLGEAGRDPPPPPSPPPSG
jgi:hypothetical protein